MTIVDWGASSVKAIAHASAAEVSGSVLDAALTRHVLGEIQQATGGRVDVGLYSDREWLHLWRQLQQVHRRLSVYRTVSLDVPSSLTEGEPVRVQFHQEQWRQWQAQMLAGFPLAVERLCGEAKISMGDLTACVVSGSLISSAAAAAQLQRQCEQVSLIVADPSASIAGAVSWMEDERQRGVTDGAAPDDVVAKRRRRSKMRMSSTIPFAHLRRRRTTASTRWDSPQSKN